MSDEDLIYDGRARKRPPGANSTVIEIYDLLDTHPDGMTVADICAALRLGFPTDAYRAYEKELKHRRNKRASGSNGGPQTDLQPPRLEFGTPTFKQHAEWWWVSSALRKMRQYQTARQEDDRWFIGERAPHVQFICEAGQRHLIPYDSKKGRAEDEARVRRAHIREEARAVLANKGLSAKARKVIEQLMELT